MNYDKKLLENLSNNISQFQEYYIEILNVFLYTGKQENKNGQITRAEIAFFRQIAELIIRLQEYDQNEINEIPKWVKYLEKIIFNYQSNNTDNLLQIEAANILLDLNLSFSKKEKESIYTKIKNKFKSEEIDSNIVELNTINDFAKKIKVKNNCFELLLAKFYLLTNKQSHLNDNLEILLKIFYIDNDKFADVINETFNTSENLYENIKIFSNFWKSIYRLFVIYRKHGLIKLIKILVKSSTQY